MPISNDELRRLILIELAYTRGESLAELLESIGPDGDMIIDSKQGQTVAIAIEEELGRPKMIRAEDQRPETLSTVSALMNLVRARIDATEPAMAEDAP